MFCSIALQLNQKQKPNYLPFLFKSTRTQMNIHTMNTSPPRMEQFSVISVNFVSQLFTEKLSSVILLEQKTVYFIFKLLFNMTVVVRKYFKSTFRKLKTETISNDLRTLFLHTHTQMSTVYLEMDQNATQTDEQTMDLRPDM